MACDEDKAFFHGESDLSYSEIDKDEGDKRQTSKSIFTDRIAKDLINSRNKVDIRLLKLHKIAENKYKTTDVIDLLGVKENLSKSLFKSISQTQSQPLSLKKEEMTHA